MRVLSSFHNLRIRYKLLLSYSAVYILAIILGSTIIYSLISSMIEKNIESVLKNSTSTILAMVKTSVEVSIKNHLRAVAEKNREIVAYFYGLHLDGVLSEKEARSRAESVLLCQQIGQTGYIYCIDSAGVTVVHPKRDLIGRNFSLHREFVQEQKARKEGYIEYDWKNPEDVVRRPKALYMTYFAPWDWIISVTSYRSEFSTLVNVEDFRDSIVSLRFGETGYSFVVDGKGNAVLHPQVEGANLFNAKDRYVRHLIEQLCELKNGKMVYSWRDPGDTVERSKLAMVNYIPDLDWIVASSSYIDEFYAPLRTVRNLFAAMVVLSLLLVLPLSVHISSTITNPLKELMNRFSADTPGDFSSRMPRKSGDELGQLASYFNVFMEKLEQYNEKLQGEIQERKQAEEGLRISEEMFAKAFRSNPNGICIISLTTALFIDVNDAFLVSTGYGRDEIINKEAIATGLFGNEYKTRRLIASIGKLGHVRNLEVEIFPKSGGRRLGVLAAEAIELRGDRCTLLTIEDITDKKDLEREIMELGDRERQRIGRDLHDDLCPHLVGIEVLSEVLNRNLEEKCSEQAPYAGRIRSLTSEAIEKTRRLARGLCPVHLDDHGLESSLRELCIKVSEVFNISCELLCKGSVRIHDNTVATHLYYIAQEAVQNAIKHGGAKQVVIYLSSDEDIICLRVADDGLGLQEPMPATGMGLRIMSQRAQMIGASFAAKRNVEGGTVVECLVGNALRKENRNGKAEA